MSTICFLALFVSAAFAQDADVIPPEEVQVVTCESTLAGYLRKRLGQGLFLHYEKSMTSEFLEKCGSFVSVKETLVSADEGASLDAPSEDVKVSYDIDSAGVDAKLVKMGIAVSGGHRVIVMASESIDNDFIESFMTSLPSLMKGEISKNECETVMDDIFGNVGFRDAPRILKKSQVMKARSFRTVMGRYKDLSTLPNFTATRAASIIDAKAAAVVVCGVDVNVQDSSVGFNACAKARCKAVDMASGKRMTTSTDSYCEKNEDKTTASIAAIRGSCESMAYELGEGLVAQYSSIPTEASK